MDETQSFFARAKRAATMTLGIDDGEGSSAFVVAIRKDLADWQQWIHVLGIDVHDFWRWLLPSGMGADCLHEHWETYKICCQKMSSKDLETFASLSLNVKELNIGDIGLENIPRRR